MTDIVASYGNFSGGTAARDGGTMVGTGSGSSFADTLLSMLDQALERGDLERQLPAGSARRSVEMFNEHGFFGVGSPDWPLHRGTPLVVSAAPFVPSPALQTEPNAVAQSYEPSVDGLESGFPADISDVAATAVFRTTTGASVHTATVGGPAQPRSTFAAGTLRQAFPQAGRRVLPMPARAQTGTPKAASRLRVAVAHNEAGVAVSVTTDSDATDDTGLHEAVSQMLARHGLVLSELRVNRRAGADARRG